MDGLILKWIVDSYLQSPHRGLRGKTPAEVWKAGESERAIHLPADLDSLESILAMREQKVLQHYGVDFPGLRYNSPELGPLRQRLAPDEKVEVRYRDELGHVWIYDKIRKVFLQVPCTNKTAIGLSRDLFEQARKIVRDAGGNADDFDAAHRAYQQIMASVEIAKRSHKMRQRREAAKTLIDKEGNMKPKTDPANQAVVSHDSKQPSFTFDPSAMVGFTVRTTDQA